MADIKGYSKSYREDLDADAIKGYLKHYDLSTALAYTKTNFTQEKLIYDDVISPIFDSFDEVSKFWDDLIAKIGVYVEGFDSIEEPEIETDFRRELFFLDAVDTVNVNTSLNVRATPGTDGAIQGSLKNADNIRIISKDGDWYQIEYLDENGVKKTGFVNKDYVTTDKEFDPDGSIKTVPKEPTEPASSEEPIESQEPLEEQPEEVEAPVDESQFFVQTNDENGTLRVRGEPGADGEIIESLNNKSELTVLGYAKDEKGNNWVQIDLGDGKVGYVSESYVKNGAGNVPSSYDTVKDVTSTIVETPPKEPPVAETKPAEFTEPEKTVPETPLEPASVPDTTNTSNTSNTIYANTNQSNLNLRAEGGAIVTSIEKGTPLTKTGNIKDGGWIEVKTNDGKTGYIKDTYTSLVNPTLEKSTVSSDKTMTVTLNDEGSHLNFRSLPSTKSGPIIGQFNQGDKLKIIDNQRTDGWVEVATKDGTHGFVHGDYLK